MNTLLLSQNNQPGPAVISGEVRVSNIDLGTRYDSVVNTLGQPMKETEREGYVVLWYGSNVPSRADLLYLRDGAIVSRSVSTQDEFIILDTFVTTYGGPVKSVARYAPELDDSFETTVHIWPSLGVAVTSNGSQYGSKVVRVQEFEGTTLPGYFETWGKDLVGNNEATISGIRSVYTQAVVEEPPISNTMNQFLENNKSYVLLLAIFIFSLFLVVVIYLFKRRRGKNSNNQDFVNKQDDYKN